MTDVPDIDVFADRDREPPPASDIPPPGDSEVPVRDRAPRADARVHARSYLGARASHRDGITVRRWRGDWYRWASDAGCYRMLTDERVDVELYSSLPIGKRSEVAEVKLALSAIEGVLIDEVDIGAWLDGPSPDGIGALDTVACRNGLVHLPTGRVLTATPRYFTTTALPIAFDVEAPKPERWLAFMRQLWGDDEVSIALLQEWFGYLLAPDTRQHKILFMIGKPRSGKGTIGRVVDRLLGGKANCAAPTLAQFGMNFGMWPLVGKLVAIVSDARLSGRADQGPIIERLLATSGEDPQNIDRKNRDVWNGILPTRIMIISNEIPSLVEASTALADRALMLKLERSFLGAEDTSLSGKLFDELQGILLWAIEGWRRLQARGRFEPPAKSRKMAEQMADLASPIGAWLRRRCVTRETEKDSWIKCDDAYADFKTWCAENGQQHVPTLARFGRDIDTVAGCERVRLSARFPDGPRPWVYRGLRVRTRAEEAADAADDV